LAAATIPFGEALGDVGDELFDLFLDRLANGVD
jgi:hypothetical protein